MDIDHRSNNIYDDIYDDTKYTAILSVQERISCEIIYSTVVNRHAE